MFSKLTFVHTRKEATRGRNHYIRYMEAVGFNLILIKFGTLFGTLF